MVRPLMLPFPLTARWNPWQPGERGPGPGGRAPSGSPVKRVQHFHVAQYSSPFREPSAQATGVSMWMPEEPWPG